MEAIWLYTASTYDLDLADDYDTLLWQSLRDIRDDPDRPASQERPELGAQVRSYRIELSKERSGTGIKSPRHVVFYTLQFEDEVFVLRILHDRMKPDRHLPKN